MFPFPKSALYKSGKICSYLLDTVYVGVARIFVKNSVWQSAVFLLRHVCGLTELNNNPKFEKRSKSN